MIFSAIRSGTVRDPTPVTDRHWLTRYDEHGEPFGELCTCAIAEDHDEDGRPNGLLLPPPEEEKGG